jgi:hypothetical protein
MGWAKRGRAEHGEGACLAHKLAFDKQAHALGRRDQQLQQQTTHLDVPHGGQSLLTLTQVRICPRCVRPRPSPDTCARTPNGPADSRRTAAPAVYKKARGGAATCPSWPRPAGPTASASVSARYTALSLSLSWCAQYGIRGAETTVRTPTRSRMASQPHFCGVRSVRTSESRRSV